MARQTQGQIMSERRKQIVVPFDFSSSALAALRVVLGLARAINGTVSMVVKPKSLSCGQGSVVGTTNLSRKTPARLAETMRRFDLTPLSGETSGGSAPECNGEPSSALSPVWEYRTADDKVRIRVEVADGQFFSQPGRTVKNNTTRLFVAIEARPRRLLSRIVQSQAEQLILESSCPVYVCPPDPTWPPRKILCPVDLTVSSAAALDWGIELARNLRAELEVLYICGSNPTLAERLGWSGLTEGRRRAVLSDKYDRANLSRFLEATDFTAVRCSQTIRRGRPERIIPRRALETQTDLVVLARQGKGANSLDGHAVANVSRRLLCSLLTIQPGEFGVELSDSGRIAS